MTIDLVKYCCRLSVILHLHMTKPLSIDDFYTDTGVFDQQKVLEALHTKVAFTRENEIIFTIDPLKLKAKDAIILYTLAKKILKANGKIESEVITYSEIMDKTKLSKSNSSVTMMRLKEKKLLLPNESGGYELPIFKVEEALTLLSETKEK